MSSPGSVRLDMSGLQDGQRALACYGAAPLGDVRNENAEGTLSQPRRDELRRPIALLRNVRHRWRAGARNRSLQRAPKRGARFALQIVGLPLHDVARKILGHGDPLLFAREKERLLEEDAADGVVLAAVAGMPAVLVDALAHLLQGACAVRDAE